MRLHSSFKAPVGRRGETAGAGRVDNILIAPMAFVLGFAAGYIGGMAGIGGGSIMTPLLIIAGVEPHHAVAASLFAIIGTSLGGIRRLLHEKLFHLKPGIIVAFSSSLGALAGSVIAVGIHAELLLYLIAAALYSSAALTLIEPRVNVKSMLARYAMASGIMFAGGFISGLAGKGGGSFAVPTLMLVVGLSSKEAAATSRLVILSNAVLADSVYILHGFFDPLLALPLVAGTYIGSSLSSRRLIRMKREAHKKLVASVYASMATLVLLKSLLS